MALHFANASETVNQSISSIIPPADISFVKVDMNVDLDFKKKNLFKIFIFRLMRMKISKQKYRKYLNKLKLKLYIRAIENYIFYQGEK